MVHHALRLLTIAERIRTEDILVLFSSQRRTMYWRMTETTINHLTAAAHIFGIDSLKQFIQQNDKTPI